MTDSPREAKMRERFERHVIEKYAADQFNPRMAHIEKDSLGQYVDPNIRIEWVDWQAACAEGREQGLEEAAKECEMLHAIHPRNSGREPDCAGLIRSLSSRKVGSDG